MNLKSIITSWNNFFFTPRPTESIALFRIGWGLILFFYYLMDLGNVVDFYGPHAILSLKTVQSQFNYAHMSLFNLMTISYEGVYVLLGIYGLAIVAVILGIYTRYSLVIMFICMVSFHQRNIWLLSSSEVLIRTVTIFLICSPCGHALSLDALLGRKYPSFRKDKLWAPWALRLIQIQLSVVYLWTVWHKMKGDTWFDGTALYYASRIEAMKNFPVPYLFDSLIFLKIATWGTLLVEIALGILIWIREFRKPVIIIGIIFHLFIEYSMSIPFFEIVMISLIMLNIPPESVKAFVDKKRSNWARAIENASLEASLKEKLLWVVRG